MTVDEFSVLFLYSAMGVYALAFVLFAFDLAGRGTRRAAASHSPRVEVGNAQYGRLEPDSLALGETEHGSNTLVAVRKTRTDTTAPPSLPDEPALASSRVIRVAVALTMLGFVLHLAADVLRGIAAARVPWANMYEFALTGTLLIVGVFLVVLRFVDLRFVGTFVVGLALLALGVASVNFYVPVVALPPALQSYWLVIHVFVASLATAFLGLGFALSFLQILKERRQAQGQSAGSSATAPQDSSRNFLTAIPSTERLENLAYRVTIIGFIFWTFTLIAGAIWAEKAWGRYWGWDTKEVWTFIIWVVYAGYIHARATRGWRGNRSAWLNVTGFAAVIFNFAVVNVFFSGLHAYSGL